MKRSGASRQRVLDLIDEHGGNKPGVARLIAEQTGVPEADVYGVATFYSLLRRPGDRLRVCQGLSCKLSGGDRLMTQLKQDGVPIEAVSCLGQCDRAPVAVDAKMELHCAGDRGAVSPASDELPMNLAGMDDRAWSALSKARKIGADAVLRELEAAGLQGRGGAGFPAHIKWRAVRAPSERPRHVVVNADEGEPGTFKDRELILRRPHLLLEGMAVAAFVVGAKEAIVYLRGEFPGPRRALERALTEARSAGHLADLDVRIVLGHGAYICGEETALLEAIEGRRGLPRLKPPYPTEAGLFGAPTLINNVETLACVPSIIARGGSWFRAQGETEPGSKLYCLSGHVRRPGVYELPLGSNLDDLAQAAGGYVGEPQAFCPGGASAGFLPMSMRALPLDFAHLAKAGAMLGSAGVVLLNDGVDLAQAALWQQVFFADESCGQCAPCRIGCQMQRQALSEYLERGDPSCLEHVEDVAWEMNEGSICGLGMVGSLPLQSAMKHFPAAFSRRDEP